MISLVTVTVDHVNEIPEFNELNVGEEITLRLLVTGAQLETMVMMGENGNEVTIPGRKSLMLQLREVVR